MSLEMDALSMILAKDLSHWTDAHDTVTANALRGVCVQGPIGWVSSESLRTLSNGGNGSRGSVPIHAKKSSVSRFPIYAGPQKDAPDLEDLYDEVTTDRGRLAAINTELVTALKAVVALIEPGPRFKGAVSHCIVAARASIKKATP